jgi:ATP-dependent DNA helicase RecQ
MQIYIKEQFTLSLPFGTHRMENCGRLFTNIRDNMGPEFTEPKGIMQTIPCRRFVEIFISATSDELKKKIIRNFIQEDSTTRIVACTEAFALGLDCRNIRQVIHHGVSHSVESYVQEAGRAGRDKKQARAILVASSVSHTSKAMAKYYKEQTTCRRQYIFTTCLGSTCTVTETKCRCCVSCSKTCTCGNCIDLNNIIH